MGSAGRAIVAKLQGDGRIDVFIISTWHRELPCGKDSIGVIKNDSNMGIDSGSYVPEVIIEISTPTSILAYFVSELVPFAIGFQIVCV